MANTCSASAIRLPVALMGRVLIWLFLGSAALPGDSPADPAAGTIAPTLPIQEPPGTSLRDRGLTKHVYDSTVVADMEDPSG